MAQLWSPSNPPSHSARDDGTFYRANHGSLSQEVAKAATPSVPLPDRVDNTTPVEIRNAFIEKYWKDDGPALGL